MRRQIADLCIPSLPNVSLIAFYGDKSPQLIALIEKLQNYLAYCPLIAAKFIPYQLEQVHGTIIGCEGLNTEQGIINKWFCDRRQEIKYIDLAGLVDYLQHQLKLPLTIRFGYERHTDYNFLSRQQQLYFRSFQLQPAAEQTIPVLLGWSWENQTVSLAIDNLRRQLQQYNLLHKYHVTPDALDNDFYLRLGTINTQLAPEVREKIATELRDLIAQEPVTISIVLKDLAFARYQNLELTPETTAIFPVADINPNCLKQLYS